MRGRAVRARFLMKESSKLGEVVEGRVKAPNFGRCSITPYMHSSWLSVWGMVHEAYMSSLSETFDMSPISGRLSLLTVSARRDEALHGQNISDQITDAFRTQILSSESADEESARVSSWALRLNDADGDFFMSCSGLNASGIASSP